MSDINNYFASHSRYNKEVMVPRYNDLLKLLDSDYMQFREQVILWICGVHTIYNNMLILTLILILI